MLFFTNVVSFLIWQSYHFSEKSCWDLWSKKCAIVMGVEESAKYIVFFFYFYRGDEIRVGFLGKVMLEKPAMISIISLDDLDVTLE